MKYPCCDPRRLQVLKANLPGAPNALEYLEVYDTGHEGDPNRQLTLIVKFLKPVPAGINRKNLRIDGGERIKTVDIDWVAIANTTLSPSQVAPPLPSQADLTDGLDPGERDQFLLVRTQGYGDFSIYTLTLINADTNDHLLNGFDPRLCEIEFSFKVQCPSDFDCATPDPCLVQPPVNPRLDYLAKDYASFRRLMLDRISTLAPDWTSRNAADLGVTLVELLAYAGDQLSYRQDAVATEAYLRTARKRTSLRRHARLVDYVVHEGCNARVWVQVPVNDDAVNIPAKTQLLTRVANLPARILPGGDDYAAALAQRPLVFETVEDTLLYQKHNRMSFYTWGDRQCCLPKGTTRATLKGKYEHLKAGDVLVFIEKIGPRTGSPADADHAHRCAVRLTDVRPGSDPYGAWFDDPALNVTNPEVDVTEIRWAEEDALPFPLCLSAMTDAQGKEGKTAYISDVSEALGNIVLADHGRSIPGELLGPVPGPVLTYAPEQGGTPCQRPLPNPAPVRFRPKLANGPLTQAFAFAPKALFSFTPPSPLDATHLLDALRNKGVAFEAGTPCVQGGDGVWSASDGVSAYRLQLKDGAIHVYPLEDAATRMTASDRTGALPAITLAEADANGHLIPDSPPWTPVYDLLESDGQKTEFVVECEDDASAWLRFGDEVHGKALDRGMRFLAAYRVGNGVAGNIGMESIAHIVSGEARLASAWNPLPAQGGVDPQSAESIRRDAPQAFRTQERAVTPDDYAAVAQRHPSVQRAVATFRWTGSWHTVFITVDRKGGGDVDEAYKQIMLDHVERYRMAGYDLEIKGPHYVPLLLDMTVCIKPDYFRGDIRAALMRVFSRGWLPDGKPALFHPDNFSFGQPVFLSALYDAAQSVEGVTSVEIGAFQRLRDPLDPKLPADGKIGIDPLEIAQLDNDPNFPERGVFRLAVRGGK